MFKQAEATAIPFADSSVTQASMAPVPTTAVGNKPAPGQTGPKGMAPRTNYSRVNAGSAHTADLGASAQKSLAPDSQSFLPHKVAHTEVHMNVSPRVTIHDMIKAAAAGASHSAEVALEAERYTQTPTVSTKQASSNNDPESIPTAYVEKLAEAMEYVVSEMDKEATAGEGPNHLEVTEAPGGKNPFQPGNQGHATSANLPPKNPGTYKPSETPTGPATALEDNTHRKHASPTASELRKAASKAPEKEMCKGCGKEKDACSCSKTAAATEPLGAVDPRLVDLWMTTVKQAEDAINPAKISAGAAVPPDTSASGEAGGAPAGGKPQGATNLIASNDSAINYTKGQAKAAPKADVRKYVTEPALSSAHDKTLGMAFANTSKAGVKIASMRSTAARVLLEKMAAESEDEEAKKKKKESGGGFTAPPVGGVAGAGGGM